MKFLPELPLYQMIRILAMAIWLLVGVIGGFDKTLLPMAILVGAIWLVTSVMEAKSSIKDPNKAIDKIAEARKKMDDTYKR